MSDSLQPHGQYSHLNSPGQNIVVGSLSLLQGIFPTQGSNPGLPHCRWILYQLSHKGSPRILEWVAYSFSTGSSWPRNWTRVSCRWILYQVSYEGRPTFVNGRIIGGEEESRVSYAPVACIFRLKKETPFVEFPPSARIYPTYHLVNSSFATWDNRG